MLLVIGAAASGKRAYVKTLGYRDADMADAVWDDRPVLLNLQDLIAAAPARAEDLLAPLLEKEVVVCNEIGSGVIPVRAEERELREQTGRLCILLAQQSDKVVRLVCGLPVTLKG